MRLNKKRWDKETSRMINFFTILYFVCFFSVSLLFIPISLQFNEWTWFYSFFFPLPFGYFVFWMRLWTINNMTAQGAKKKKTRLFGALMFLLKYFIYAIPLVIVLFLALYEKNIFNIYSIISVISAIISIIIITWIYVIVEINRKEG